VKKGFSILMVLLIALTILPITVATHFCGGEIAASKISISGKLASCGMEGPEKRPALPGNSIASHCCDDVVTFCGTDNNYTPSFSFIPEFFQYNFQVLAIPLWLYTNSNTFLIPLYTNVNPPGTLMSTSVDLSGICVLRI
jgi:hypothetical protein